MPFALRANMTETLALWFITVEGYQAVEMEAKHSGPCES